MLEICEDANVLTIIYIVKLLLNFLAVLVPIIMIVLITIDFVKLVLNPNSEKSMKSVGARIAIGVGFFLLPSILSIIFSIFGMKNTDDSNCWKNANPDYIDSIRNKEKANSVDTNKKSTNISKQLSNGYYNDHKYSIMPDNNYCFAIDDKCVMSFEEGLDSVLGPIYEMNMTMVYWNYTDTDSNLNRLIAGLMSSSIANDPDNLLPFFEYFYFGGWSEDYDSSSVSVDSLLRDASEKERDYVIEQISIYFYNKPMQQGSYMNFLLTKNLSTFNPNDWWRELLAENNQKYDKDSIFYAIAEGLYPDDVDSNFEKLKNSDPFY